MAEESLEKLIRKLGGEIINVGKPVKTVEQAVKATGSSPKQIIKSLLFISGKEGPILVIVDGESRVDLEKVAKIFGRVRLATPEEVKRITGFEVGGLPPVGIEVKTMVDPKVLKNEFVIGGGGNIDRLSKINPKKIVEYQKAVIVDVKVKGELEKKKKLKS
jgi:prolyl-tRNA editing enzyme YbaK/EbsC (Cys-tRNA(Pro) deacylase)